MYKVINFNIVYNTKENNLEVHKKGTGLNNKLTVWKKMQL